MEPIKLLVIGGSAGSLEVILRCLPELQLTLPFAIVIVLHRKNTFDNLLNTLLASRTAMPVKEIEEKETILPAVVYIASADYHLLIEKDYTFSLDFSEKINYSRPSIDVTFETAAEAYGAQLACLLLSGANADGVEGLKVVKALHGCVAVQHPDDAEVAFMPRQAIEQAHPDYILRNDQIAPFINLLGNGQLPHL